MSERSWNLLVVEDDESLRELIALWLPEQYRVTLVESAARAVEVLSEKPIDILLTDFHMPDMDGLDLLLWCRRGGLHFPVIFMTASHVRFPREELAVSDCCAELMMKPFSRTHLADTLLKMRERSHGRDCQLH